MLKPTHKAAGILFRTPAGEGLFLQRGPNGDYPGYWCFPGGHVEDGETFEDAAKREAVEEIGALPKGKRTLIARSISAQQEISAPAENAEGTAPANALLPGAVPEAQKIVDYATFAQDVAEPFDVERDAEHIGYAWSPLSTPPEPLHPGARVALDRLCADELGVARMMMDGRLTSPQRYANMTLWVMRITGTGVSYRMPVLDRDADGNVVADDDGNPVIIREEEFPWRDPALYLNEEFLARCSGLPVVWKHPEGATLDSKEFADRVVGTVFLPFILGDEVWCVAKVWDDEASKVLSSKTEDGYGWSTSPAVVLSDPNNPSYKFRLEDGSLLLVEGKPSLVDHLAICERGVWDKGGEPTGVIINDSEQETAMSTKKEATLEDVLAAVGHIGQRVEEIGARVDAIEDIKAKADADADDDDDKKKVVAKVDEDADADEKKADEDADEDADEKKADEDADDDADADEKKADKKDSNGEDAEKKGGRDAAKETVADARKDAEVARKDAAALRKENNALAKRIKSVEDRLPQDRSDDDHRSMSSAQARADAVYELFGKQAPRFMSGEGIGEYRRRLVRTFAEHSPAWKSVDVGALPDTAFEVAETQIYADAAAAAKDAVGVEDGGLRMVPGHTPSGHQKIEFFGHPSAWLGRFSGSRRFATRISPNTKREVV